MELVETAAFTERIMRLLNEEEYLRLHANLVARPKQGDVIPGTVGLRKLRWGAGARGKRGGIRVIYYCYDSIDRILLMYAYDKATQGDLTKHHLRLLSNYVKDGVL